MLDGVPLSFAFTFEYKQSYHTLLPQKLRTINEDRLRFSAAKGIGISKLSTLLPLNTQFMRKGLQA